MQEIFGLRNWNIDRLREFRLSAAIYCLFASLVLFGVRPRGSLNQALFIFENLLFVSSVTLFPWTIRQARQILFFLTALFVYTSLITTLYYNNRNDWLISVLTFATFVKCIVAARLIFLFDAEKTYKVLLVTIALLLLSQVAWYAYFGFDIRDGFSAQIGDRNYFSLLDVFLLASLLMLRKRVKLNIPFENFLAYLMLAVIFFLVMASGSRTGVLAISILIMITFAWRGLIIWFSLLFLAYVFDFTRVFEYRYINQFSAPLASSEAGRFAMVLAAIETYALYPWGLLTGFGLMATSHLEWMMVAYKKMGNEQLMQIQHNSIFDFIFSFGIAGLIFLLKSIKKIGSVSILIFLGVTTVFNNVLIFLPLYIFIGTYFLVKNKDSTP